MKIIEIKYKNEIKQCFVDDEDYEFLNQYHWNYVKQGYAYGYKKPYKKEMKLIFMHRLLMGLEFGNKIQVDHIDHNGLNNCRTNLRLSTQKQNCQNRIANINSTSQFLGVHKKRNRKKCKDGYHYYGTRYVAKIKFNGFCKYIGSFTNEIIAAKMYDKVASLIFGEFANLNFK